MQEQMTKQDAIEYLLYMKHDVQAKSHMDIALDTAIEALKQPTIEAEQVRHGRFTDNGEDKFICSACKGYVYRWFGKSDFCPNCGARMDVTDTNVGRKGGNLESETIEIDEMKSCCCISDEEAKMILEGADNG